MVFEDAFTVVNHLQPKAVVHEGQQMTVDSTGRRTWPSQRYLECSDTLGSGSPPASQIALASAAVDC